VDLWDGETYRRAVVVGDRAVELAAVQSGSASDPVLDVAAYGRSLPDAVLEGSARALERALGLSVALRPFYRVARQDPRLAPLAARFRGLKPPRFPSVFEAIVNGVACQQLSLAVGIVLLNRLTRRCGLAVGGDSSLRAFPRPSDVVSLDPHDLRAMGYSANKTRALLELARAVESGLDLEALAELGDEEAVERLMAIRGIGRWTAEYVLLRGLGRLTTFPGDDVGARTNLARWMKLREPLDYATVCKLARRWHPFGGFLYFHLLLQKLEEGGAL
jgi:DNA-3-methyladenine glycosylase II